jgi:hypothetical protein
LVAFRLGGTGYVVDTGSYGPILVEEELNCTSNRDEERMAESKLERAATRILEMLGKGRALDLAGVEMVAYAVDEGIACMGLAALVRE